MRNNRLLIEYNDKSLKFPNGFKESMRVNSVDRAKEIMLGIEKRVIRKAVYNDKDGNVSVIIG